MKPAKIISCAVVLSFAMVAICMAAPVSDGAEPFDITDSTGKTFTFNGPANKVVSFSAHTLTVIEMGLKDRIVAIDYYSTSEYLKGDPRVEGLDSLNIGKVSKTTADTVVAKLVQLVDDGKFNTETDVVLSVAWSSLTAEGGLRDKLVEKGFKVLCLKGDTYDEIVEVVEKVAKVLDSEKGRQIAQRMVDTKIMIQNKVNDNVKEVDKTKFVLAWYTSGKLKIGNTTSVAVNFAETAGGKNAGEKPDSTESLYAAEVAHIIQANPSIVITSNYDGTSEGYQKDVLHTDAVAVLALKSSWNNYCPDAELGLKTIAKYLYPNLFGDLEAAPDVDYAPSAVIQEPSEGTSLENFVEENIDLGIVVFAIFVTLIAVFFIAKD